MKPNKLDFLKLGRKIKTRRATTDENKSNNSRFELLPVFIFEWINV